MSSRMMGSPLNHGRTNFCELCLGLRCDLPSFFGTVVKGDDRLLHFDWR